MHILYGTSIFGYVFRLYVCFSLLEKDTHMVVSGNFYFPDLQYHVIKKDCVYDVPLLKLWWL